MGVNKGISIGNKTDLDEADYLEYLLGDEGTGMVFLYLEFIGDGRRLLDLARSSTKPIIVHKANRVRASQSVAFSHTAALANDDRIVRRPSVRRASSAGRAFGTSVAIQALALPPVRGEEIVVISRSGGHAVIAADAADRNGFRLASMPDSFVQTVRGLFRADVITPTNPLDLGAIFDFDLYARIVEGPCAALSPDAVLLINTYSPEEADGARRMAHRVEEMIRETDCPIAMCVYARGDERQALQAELRVPVFFEIEEGLRGLAASRTGSAGLPFTPHRSRPRVPRLPRPSPTAPGCYMADRVLALCQAYGIPAAAWEMQRSSRSGPRRQTARISGGAQEPVFRGHPQVRGGRGGARVSQWAGGSTGGPGILERLRRPSPIRAR